ncbi:hypothetical protein, partial [Pseudomonas sp. HY2-MNA-CIBAN-0224]
QQYYAYLDMLTFSPDPIEQGTEYSIESLAIILATDMTLVTSTKKNDLWAKYQLAAANYLASQGLLSESLVYARQAIVSFSQL